jgi:hypothetical protein
VVASAAMSAAIHGAVDRPSVRISFRLLAGIAIGLAFVAFMAGRHIYKRYGGYRPLALVHVPPTVRYRARVDLGDAKRVDAVLPLLHALDPRQQRLPALEKKLGVSLKSAAREFALGVGPDPFDFVLVLGLQLQAGTGLPAAKALCEVLVSDGIRLQPTDTGCRLEDGAVVGGTPDGALVLASRAELIKGLLQMPDLGDRLGFSGPSVRGAAPEVTELARETSTLVQRIAAKYP